jgi:hypothetical protein
MLKIQAGGLWKDGMKEGDFQHRKIVATWRACSVELSGVVKLP